jgi:hypothetical protein
MFALFPGMVQNDVGAVAFSFFIDRLVHGGIA